MFISRDHTFAICAYKESPFLDDCIQSVLAQTVPSNVLIATSTPNEHIARLARNNGIALHISGKEPGICSDWNYAVSCADTPLVTIAHQDDVYCPSYTDHMLSGMNGATDPLIFFSNYGELREGSPVENNTLLRIKRLLLHPIARRRSTCDKRVKRMILSIGSSICCPSVTLNIPKLPNPPFQSHMKSNLDWDTWERYARLDGSFVYDPEILMHHRVHEGSTTSALIKDNTRESEDLEMLKRFWPSPIAHTLNRFYALGQKSNS